MDDEEVRQRLETGDAPGGIGAHVRDVADHPVGIDATRRRDVGQDRIQRDRVAMDIREDRNTHALVPSWHQARHCPDASIDRIPFTTRVRAARSDVHSRQRRVRPRTVLIG